MKQTRLHRIFNYLLILVFLISTLQVEPGKAAGLPPVESQAATAPSQQVSATPAPGEPQVGYNTETGKLSFVGGDAAAPLWSASAGQVSALSTENAAAAVLARYGAGFGLKNPSRELRLDRTEKSSRGKVLRYQQHYNGIPVVGGELLINSDAQGNILSLNGEVSPDLALSSTVPTLSAEQAVQIALAGMQSWYNLAPEQISASQPALWIYDERIFKPSEQPVSLVWRMEVQAVDGAAPLRELVLVDARTGKIALHFNQVDTAWQAQADQPTPEPSETAVTTIEPTATPQPTATEQPTLAPTTEPQPGISPTPEETTAAPVDSNSAQFQVESSGQVPASITVTAGNNQYASHLRPFAARLQISVKDSLAAPVAGVEITFTAPDAGASGTFVDSGSNSTRVITDVNGLATAPEFSANTIQGSYLIQAAVAGLSQTADFTLTNKDIYVSPDGANPTTSTGAECTDPAFPCKTIVYAISKTTSGVTIFLRSGVYSEAAITINTPIVLISGGWNDDFTVQTGQSILNRGDNGTGFTIINNRNLDLFNIILRNGSIDNNSTISLRNSALIDSYSTGINNEGTATLINTTIDGTIPAGTSNNNGIRNSGSLNLKNVTITNVSGYAVYNSGMTTAKITIQNSILAGNTHTCTLSSGSLVSAGHNLFGPMCTSPNGTPISLSSTDLVNVDPKLSELINQSYRALLPGSPAIDAIDPNEPGAACPAVDQRGAARPANGKCDIGAYEYTPPGAPAVLLALSLPNQTVGPNMAFIDPFKIQALDATGAPISGITVTFSAPSSGASGTFAGTHNNIAQAETDANGIITAPKFSPNAENGRYTVTASAGASSFDFQLGNGTPALYVDGQNGSDGTNNGNNCSSAANPCKTVSNGLTHALAGDLIYIASGEYSSTTMVANVTRPVYLSGGWDSTYSQQTGRSVFKGLGSDPNQRGLSVARTALVSADRIDFIDERTAVANYGILVLQNSTLRNNQGGISNVEGTAELTNVNITATQGTGLFNGGSLRITNGSITKGILAVQNRGNLDLTNITISDNTCYTNNTAGCGFTSGIYNSEGGIIRLTNATITRNFAFTSDVENLHFPFGAGIFNVYSTVLLQNSIVARNQGNYGQDCYGEITSLGHNLIGNSGGCTLTSSAGDLIGTAEKPLDPKLADLADNSGSLTSALLPDSPAIDSGDPAVCPAVDQRGAARPVGSACDTGAYEGTETGTAAPQIFVLTLAGPGSTWPFHFICRSPQASCTSGADLDADLAYLYANGTRQLFQDQYNRNSLDDAGMAIVSSVHDGLHPNNAYWDGYEMFYGESYSRADDVVAHELTHAVTQYTSNLFYYYQSGAISESLSDLWGEYYDQTNQLGRDEPASDWLLGEDLPGGALRSMSNPPAYGDPDRMTSPNYYQGWQDNGGVHINSGVNNKAVSLLVDGGSFNGQTITPLGQTRQESWAKVGAIYYQAQTHFLTSGSDYSDLYNALYLSCNVLAVDGSKGVLPQDCQQVRNATTAVQMNLSPSSSYNPDAPACPAGFNKTPANLFFDGFEEGNANWISAAKIGNPHWNVAPGSVNLHYAASGQYALFGNDYDETRTSKNQVSDSSAAMKNSVRIPTGLPTFLSFKHAFGFEYGILNGVNYYFDGGVLEYTLDNGVTWIDAKPLFSAGQNYQGTIYNTTATGYNPLKARSAFVSDSHGYVSTRYALTTLAGKTVRFRWRIGTDYTGFSLGWAVDDVAIYTCEGNPSVPVLAAPINGSLVTTLKPKLDWGNASYANHYEVEVATDSGFVNTVLKQQNTSGTLSEFVFPTELLPNTRYYWHVRTANSLDVLSAWSATWSFRTQITKPVVISPVNGAALKTLRPDFTWAKSDGAVSYTLVISTYSNYSYPVLNKTFLANGFPTMTHTPAVDLPAGKKLYGRIMANGANPSAWTAFNFTTPLAPPAPVLIAPLANELRTGSGTPTVFLPTLSWKAVIVPVGASPFDHYELQVSDAVNFSPLLYPSETVDTANLKVTTFRFPTTLENNHKYYWRVRAYNLNGDFSPWAGSSFRTAILKPELIGPTSSTSLHTLRPAFEWTEPTGATSYTLVVSLYPDLSSPLLNTTVYSAAYTPSVDLPAGKMLYWRVCANGPNGPSLWSDAFNFTTPLAPPALTLVSPLNNGLLTGTPPPTFYLPTLRWNPASIPLGASPFDHYELQLSDVADFSSMLYPNGEVDTANLKVTSFSVPTPLQDNHKYYWRVRAYNLNGDYSPWTAFSFRTAILKPELLGPESGAVLKSLQPDLNWTAPTGATSYTLVISTYPNLSSPLVNMTVNSAPYTPTTPLPAGKMLYWQVRANGPNGPSLWSTPRNFKTPIPPSVPVLVIPINNDLRPGSGTPTVYFPTFSWKPVTVPLGASPFDHYELQLSDSVNFSPLLYPSDSVDTANLKVTSFRAPTTLLDNHRYYWRVLAYNQNGDYNSSALFSFRTAIQIPALSAPLNDPLTPLNSLRPAFAWSSSPGATSYTIAISTYSNLSYPLVNTVSISPAYTPTVDLPTGKPLYWYVRANGANGPSAWSSIWSFRTK